MSPTPRLRSILGLTSFLSHDEIDLTSRGVAVREMR